MERFHALLLAVWREACRNIEIEESTRRIAALLRPRLPLTGVLVRRLDRVQGCLQTVAEELFGEGCAGLERRTDLTAEGLHRFLGACARGSILYPAIPVGGVEPAVPEYLRIAGLEGCSLIVGVLGARSRPAGVLVFIASGERPFDALHQAVAGELLEPFSAALENDQRLHEVLALREAAEADRSALLRRLGRQRLSDEVVGADRGGLHEVMKRVELVAASDAPVLLIGETGTGKELISRAIHERSPRSAGPVLRVNCGAIPPELIDSQLFGHERGAFTGALDQRKGWFERADGGTLFLDEIAELPPAAQVRLLRVLQDGWFERVGGQRAVHVDVRIVAATHRDLPSMVSQGQFRADLWYRIAVFPILLPPLRERQGDIPALARHFAQRAATRFGLAPVLPTAGDIAVLQGYSWPGNIRELASVIDRAAILGDGRSLEVVKALGAGPHMGGSMAGVEPVPAGRAAGVAEVRDRTRTLDEVMRVHIEAVLVQTRGRIEGPHGAAGLLGINPHTLRGKMRRLGIQWRAFREGASTP